MIGIDCLIFSKDRPAQLDLLLRSIKRHAPDLYRSINVLLAVSDLEYSRGYSQLASEHSDSVSFFDQYKAPFDEAVFLWLGNACEVISFLVDDCVFYRDATPPPKLPWSYRGGDYDYPFSLDGNVYAKDDIVKLLDGLHFRNPTELEAFGHTRCRRLPFSEVEHGEPCLVGIPANRVSVSSGMPHMGVDPAGLNRRYLAGERLAIPKVDGDLPAHAELELVFA